MAHVELHGECATGNVAKHDDTGGTAGVAGAIVADSLDEEANSSIMLRLAVILVCDNCKHVDDGANVGARTDDGPIDEANQAGLVSMLVSSVMECKRLWED